MSFNWSSYHKVACLLLEADKESGLEEAYYRASISRFYYSVFDYLRVEVEKQFGKELPEGQSTNNYIQSKYAESEHEETKAIGVNFDRLWARRIEADYYRHKKITNNDAVQSKKMSRYVLENLDKINLEPSLEEPEEMP